MVFVDRSKLINLALLLGSVGISIVIISTFLRGIPGSGEVGLGTLIVDEYRIRFMEPSGQYCLANYTHLEPGCQLVQDGSVVRVRPFRVSINDDGFRGAAVPEEKPEGVYRIFVLGDSFSFGEGVDDDETFSILLEQSLNAPDTFSAEGRAALLTFEVLNLGRPGGGTDAKSQTLSRYARFDPDLVILQTLGNDVYECEDFRTQVDARIASGDLVLDDALAQLDPYHRYGEIARSLSNEKKCGCVLDSLDSLLSLAEQLGIGVLLYNINDDLENDCLSSGPYEYLEAGDHWQTRAYWLSRLDPHPNAQGHALIAEELLPVVRSMIAEEISTDHGVVGGEI